MEAKITQAYRSHIPLVAENMRQVDIDEVDAAAGMTPLEALEWGFVASDSLVLISETGTPVAMGGAAPSDSLPGWGVVWLLGTPWITDHPLAMTKLVRDVLKELKEMYKGVYNWVDDRNEPAKRWLGASGFTLMSPAPYGKKGKDFCYFYKRS